MSPLFATRISLCEGKEGPHFPFFISKTNTSLPPSLIYNVGLSSIRTEGRFCFSTMQEDSVSFEQGIGGEKQVKILVLLCIALVQIETSLTFRSPTSLVMSNSSPMVISTISPALLSSVHALIRYCGKKKKDRESEVRGQTTTSCCAPRQISCTAFAPRSAIARRRSCPLVPEKHDQGVDGTFIWETTKRTNLTSTVVFRFSGRLTLTTTASPT